MKASNKKERNQNEKIQLKQRNLREQNKNL